jgi:hypothetical protein
VLKGTHKGDQLEVFHYRMKEGAHVANGPLLPTFHTQKMLIWHNGGATSITVPTYLLFLKRRKDGRYECVSGQFDSLLSVKQLIEPLASEKAD